MPSTAARPSGNSALHQESKLRPAWPRPFAGTWTTKRGGGAFSTAATGPRIKGSAAARAKRLRLHRRNGYNQGLAHPGDAGLGPNIGWNEAICLAVVGCAASAVGGADAGGCTGRQF